MPNNYKMAMTGGDDMAIMMRRQLNDDEKRQILERYGMKCYATGHVIPEGEVEFDHIKAYSKGGLTDLNNIAPMCKEHNRQKGALSLGDFKIKLRIAEFFKRGDRLTLKDMLQYLKDKGDIVSFGDAVAVNIAGDSVTIDSASGQMKFKVEECP